jgi:hypothetical protein
MPLDPSIFMQGAQLKAQNDARTQSIIGGFFDKLAANKQKQIDLEKAKATDYEGSAMRVLQAKAQGVAPDPADLVRAKAYGEFQSMQNAYDPNTASVYPKNRNIFETMGTAPSTAQYESPYVTLGGTPSGGAMPPSVGSKPFNNDLGFEMLPVGDNYAQVSQVTPPQRDMARGVVAPMGASPKTQQKAEELNLEVNAAGAKKQAELDAEKQFNAPIAKQKISTSYGGLLNLNQDIDRAIENTDKLSAGLGSLTSAVPSTPAANLRATLDTIQADAAFGALQQMRDNSPTGGALGAVSEKELALLMSAQAALSQSQDAKQLKDNLIRYRDIRTKALENVAKAYKEQYGEDLGIDLGKLQKFNDPKAGMKQREAIFNLKKRGFTQEQIDEYKKVRGIE